MVSTDIFSLPSADLDNFVNFLTRQAFVLISCSSLYYVEGVESKEKCCEDAARKHAKQKSGTDYAGERVEILFAERTVVSASLLPRIS
jgi:hypothetical protein